ncbi:MAG: hypothetical protein HY591_04845, partial [Candidatus Omnitrophica bacterium]|nr:hypothetical protein [Candidatus Omnitrophota bacterium]
MYLRKYPLRFAIVFIFLLAGFLYSILFLLYIQIFRSSHLAGLAERQHEHAITIEPKRGTIYDRNLRPLAVNLPVYSLYANPRVLRKQHDVDQMIVQLAAILKMDPAVLKAKVNKDKYFVWVARKLPQDVYE